MHLPAMTTLALLTPAALSQCMTDADAHRVASNFGTLMTSFSPTTALRVLCANLTEYSDSVNSLMNNGCARGPAPLGTAIFTSREAFIAGQGVQPSVAFEILDVWHDCDAVTLRWRSTDPGAVRPEQPVTGIMVLETGWNAGGEEPWVIERVFSEFNGVAMMSNLGMFRPRCNESAPAIERKRSLYSA